MEPQYDIFTGQWTYPGGVTEQKFFNPQSTGYAPDFNFGGSFIQGTGGEAGSGSIPTNSGMAINPRTGQLEMVYATYDQESGGTMRETGRYFASDGNMPAGAVPMAGANSGYYVGDARSTSLGELGVIGGLAALGGLAGAGVAGIGPGAAAAEGSAIAGAAEGAVGSSGLGGGIGVGSGGGEAILGSGLTAGTTTGGIGGGSLGAGLTTGTTTGAVGGGALGSGVGAGAGSAATGAGLGGTAMGTGFFSGESLTPVLGGASAAAGASGLGSASAGASPVTTGAASGAAGAGGASVWDRITNGTATPGDWASIAGNLAPGILGYLGAQSQSDAYSNLANQYMGFGAPYRAQLADISANPNNFINSAPVRASVDQGTNAMARALSVNGNPAGSGSALQELQSYATNNLWNQYGAERDRLAGYGGLTQYASAAPSASSNAINAQGGMYNAVGYGLGNLLNPRPTLTDFGRALRGLV